MIWIANKTILNENIIENLKLCEKSNIFTNNGVFVKKLENFIKDKFKIDESKAVICCNNGTSALYALVSGIEIFHKKHIKWATQSFTFPSSAQGILKNTTILDIDKDGGLDLKLVGENIDGIIVTNCFGNVVDIDKYIAFCNKKNIFLIFDNAGTSYTFYKGKNSCNYGNGSIISFHHTKPFGFGEGGAIIVDLKYENKIRKLLNFGIDNKNISIYEQYWSRLGANYKLTEISAIFILEYIKTYFEKIVIHHREIYNFLKTNEKLFNITLFPNFADPEKTVPMCISLLHIKFTKQVISQLKNINIYSRKYYIPLINTLNSSILYNKILCLPCNIDVDLNKYKDITLFLNG
jgi:dTDP-4-amino-4,6-dideoxygalactose transaminase